MKQLSKFVAVLLLMLPLANAQQTRVYGEGGNWTQEITGSLAAVKNLRVKVDIGSVRVEGGSQHRASATSSVIILIAVRKTKPAANSILTRSPRTFAEIPRGSWANGRAAGRISSLAEFVINVPREMDEIKVETEGGNVSTTGVSGRVDAQSGGGNIRVDDIGGKINAETGGGSIDVGNVASDVSLHTGGGSIKVNSAKGKIEAESGGGSVTIVSGSQDAVLETGGGNIQVEHCSGQVKASTGGGSIDLGDIGGPVEMETGGGSIRLSSAKGQSTRRPEAAALN